MKSISTRDVQRERRSSQLIYSNDLIEQLHGLGIDNVSFRGDTISDLNGSSSLSQVPSEVQIEREKITSNEIITTEQINNNF